MYYGISFEEFKLLSGGVTPTPGSEANSIDVTFEFDNGTDSAYVDSFKVNVYEGTVDPNNLVTSVQEDIVATTGTKQVTIGGLEQKSYIVEVEFYHGEDKVLTTNENAIDLTAPGEYTVDVTPAMSDPTNGTEWDQVVVDLSGQTNVSDSQAASATVTATDDNGNLLGEPVELTDENGDGNLDDDTVTLAYVPGATYNIQIDYYNVSGQLLNTQEITYDGLMDPGHLAFDIDQVTNEPKWVNVQGFEWPATDPQDGIADPHTAELVVTSEQTGEVITVDENGNTLPEYIQVLDYNDPQPISFEVWELLNSQPASKAEGQYSFEVIYKDANGVQVATTEEIVLDMGSPVVKGTATVSNLNSDGSGLLVEVEGFQNGLKSGENYDRAVLTATTSTETINLGEIALVDENDNQIVTDTYSFEVQDSQLPAATDFELNIEYVDDDGILPDTTVDTWTNQSNELITTGTPTVTYTPYEDNFGVTVTVDGINDGKGVDDADTAVLQYGVTGSDVPVTESITGIDDETTSLEFKTTVPHSNQEYWYQVAYYDAEGNIVGTSERVTATTGSLLSSGEVEVIQDDSNYGMIEGVRVNDFVNGEGVGQAYNAQVYVMHNGMLDENPIATVDISNVTTGTLEIDLSNYTFEYGNEYKFIVAFEGYDELGNSKILNTTSYATGYISSPLSLGEVEYQLIEDPVTHAYDGLAITFSDITDANSGPGKQVETKVWEVKVNIRIAGSSEIVYSTGALINGGGAYIEITNDEYTFVEGEEYEFEITYLDPNQNVIPTPEGEDARVETWVATPTPEIDLQAGTLTVEQVAAGSTTAEATVTDFVNGTYGNQEAEEAILYGRNKDLDGDYEVIAIDNNLEDGVSFTSSIASIESYEFYVEYIDEDALDPEDRIVNATEEVDLTLYSAPEDDGLSGGAIAGIVIGSVVGVVLLGWLGYHFVSKRQENSSERQDKREERKDDRKSK